MLLAIAFCGSMSLPSRAAAADYPVVFTSAAPLRKLGIAVSFGDTVTPFNNKCYYYGDGGYLISMSDEFLSRFVSQGFTLQSACLGLISLTHYDPETGSRLATYMIVDRAMIEQRSEEPGAATEELPLELPSCFRNANPYTDCVFNYGRITGKKLSAAETQTYKNLGAGIDAILAAQVSGSPAKEEFYGSTPEEKLIAGFRKYAGMGLPGDGPQLDGKLDQYSSFALWIRSSKLPRGYGYALDADGTAGPSLSAAAMAAAISGISKSQMSPDDLKRALEARK
jgi:hypothetical protein